jgi:hypothetical protein
MTEDEIFAAGAAVAVGLPPLPDDVIAKIGAILAPVNLNATTRRGGEPNDRANEAA